MLVVYIAGRYRGKNAWEVHQNVVAAEKAAMQVALAGAMPLCPHLNAANFNGTLTDQFWLEGTMELLKRSDAIYVFDAYDLTRSSGTIDEWKWAQASNMPRLTSVDDLVKFVESREPKTRREKT